MPRQSEYHFFYPYPRVDILVQIPGVFSTLFCLRLGSSWLSSQFYLQGSCHFPLPKPETNV